jgi:dihydrofolate synthase/folylpolyglutamate synthase
MHQPRTAAHFDLRRMDELLVRLGNPHLKARTVHVAGTKGKGSTAAMIASVLTSAGYKTGLYTSPHLIDLRERFRVDNKLISRATVIRLVDRLKPEVEVVNKESKYGKLTTFELLTALGFLYFAQERVIFQVIEAGLGGRLDATNVVHPDVCVITAIGLDHTDTLGNSLVKIANEKAGIIKHNSVVISSPQPEKIIHVIEEKSLENNAQVIRVGIDITWKLLSYKVNKQLLDIIGRLNTYRVTLPLLGIYQRENTAVAIAVLEVLIERGFNITHDDVINGLKKVNWVGRFQILKQRPLMIADGAHNPASICQLKLSLTDYIKRVQKHQKNNQSFNNAILVIGLSDDKDISRIITELLFLFTEVIVTHSQHPRAMETELLATEFKKRIQKVHITKSVPEAISLALALTGKRDLICITGSLFVVGEAIEYLDRGSGRKN